MRIEPFELGPVEHGVGAAHALKRKLLQQVFCPQKLFVSAGRPAQQREKITKRFRKKTLGAVHIYIGCTVTLRKAGFVRAENQRHMRKNRRLRAQRPVEQYLFRRIRNVVGATNHVRDAHINVVDDHTELIHGLAEFLIAFSGAQQDKILDFLIRKLAFTEHRVDKFSRFTQRHFEAHRRLHARCRRFAIAARTARDAARPASLGFLVLRRFGVIASGIFFRGAITQKCGSVGQTFFSRRKIQSRSLRLVKRPLIPIDAQPLQTIENSLHQFGLVALGIGVFDTKDHRAALSAREQPVKQSGAGSSHVQITSGGRSKPHPYGRCLVVRVTHCQRDFPLELKLSV